MTVQMQEKTDGRILEIHASGKLTKEDYKEFLPQMERLIERFGKLNLLFDMHDFHGWELGALWEDFKFDVKHFRDVERLAVVGEKKWQTGMAVFCKPFTTAKIRYFERDKMEEAQRWIGEASCQAASYST